MRRPERNCVVKIPVSKRELAALAGAAARDDLPVATFFRRCLFQHMRQQSGTDRIKAG